MRSAPSGSVHPLWTMFRDPTLEAEFLEEGWSRDRIQGALLSGLSALIFLAGSWIDQGLEAPLEGDHDGGTRHPRADRAAHPLYGAAASASAQL